MLSARYEIRGVAGESGRELSVAVSRHFTGR